MAISEKMPRRGKRARRGGRVGKSTPLGQSGDYVATKVDMANAYRAAREAERIIWEDRRARPQAYQGEVRASRQRPGAPQPLDSLTASAQRLTNNMIGRTSSGAVSEQDWQVEAWDMFDEVGEEHFLAGTLASYMGQARLFIGRQPDNPTDDLEQVEDGPAVDLLDLLRGQAGSTSSLLTRFGINLFVAGDGYLVGVPRDGYEYSVPDSGQFLTTPSPGAGDTSYRIPLDEVEWSMRSVEEVKVSQGLVTIDDGSPDENGEMKGRQYNAEDVYLVRVWRPHPRKNWWADSPTRASLPVLRELVALTMHVGAQVDSRLAGAGMLIFPSEAQDAVKAQNQSAGENDPDADDAEDNPVMSALMMSMIDPLKNRDSAAAVVPLVVTPPSEYADKIRKIDFSTPLDDQAMTMREEAIRRLALGQDCPPELLLGTDSMNHWGAWLVKEDTVTTHLEPPLALVCDALTSGFLWPLLVQGGMSEEEAGQYVIWYDVDHLIIRPNRAQDAKDLHAAGALSDEALRDAAGFNETDAPPVKTEDPAVTTALSMVQAAPSLAQEPGLIVLVAQLREVMGLAPAGSAEQAAPVPTDEEPPSGNSAPADGGPPQQETGPGNSAPAVDSTGTGE